MYIYLCVHIFFHKRANTWDTSWDMSECVSTCAGLDANDACAIIETVRQEADLTSPSVTQRGCVLVCYIAIHFHLQHWVPHGDYVCVHVLVCDSDWWCLGFCAACEDTNFGATTALCRELDSWFLVFSEPSNVFEVFLIDFCYSLESGCWFRGRRDQSNIVVVAAAAAA